MIVMMIAITPSLNASRRPLDTGLLAGLVATERLDRLRAAAYRPPKSAQLSSRRIAMNAEDLRALQRPLKERYRTDPAAARVTLRARGKLEEGVAATIEGFRGPVRTGLHPATGGTGNEACSGDILLQALAACAGVTL